MNRLLDAKEVAELFGLPSPKWVLAQASQDKIPHVRLGRYVRFDAEALELWLRTEVARGPKASER